MRSGISVSISFVGVGSTVEVGESIKSRARENSIERRRGEQVMDQVYYGVWIV